MGEWLRQFWRWWVSPGTALASPLRAAPEGDEEVLEPPEPLLDPGLPEVLTPFAEHHNAFAFDLFAALRGQPGNLVFSPLSLWAALGMVLAGARLETAAQLRQVLRFEDGADDAFAQTIEALESGSRLNEFRMATSLWCDGSYSLQPDFVDRLARHYRGTANAADFRNHPEEVRSAVNRWMAEATRALIPELISVAFDRATRLVIATAVFFDGKWACPFEYHLTRDAPFHLDTGETVQAPLMQQQGPLRYVQMPGYQAVDLAYRGGDAISMLVLLPDEQTALREIEASFSAGMLQDCVTRMTVRDVVVFLPRFRANQTVELKDALIGMGMPLPLSPLADFSGINGIEPPDEAALFISEVAHQAFINVNEHGTQAAAATEFDVLAGFSARAPAPTFRADRPFLFAIRDRRTGTVLFMGRIADPRA
jgi:serpin B